MAPVHFAWDERKDKANQKKHRVSFGEARTVFYDENARLIPDPGYSSGEERFILLGASYRLRLLTVCHCYREGDRLIRIISARKATKTERKQYEEKLP